MGGQHHAQPNLPTGKTQYPLHRRLCGSPRPVWTAGKISPQMGFHPRTTQPVAILCNGYAKSGHPGIKRGAGGKCTLLVFVTSSRDLTVLTSIRSACMKWVGHVYTNWRVDKCKWGFGWKSWRKEPLGRPWRRYTKVSIKFHVKEKRWVFVDWIHLAKDMGTWWALMNTVINYHFTGT
jgi:hypothetical protein